MRNIGGKMDKMVSAKEWLTFTTCLLCVRHTDVFEAITQCLPPQLLHFFTLEMASSSS